MAVFPSEGFGQRISKALGIDKLEGRATSIQLNVKAGACVTAEVQFRLSAEGTEEALKVIEAVNWKEELGDAQGDTKGQSVEATDIRDESHSEG